MALIAATSTCAKRCYKQQMLEQTFQSKKAHPGAIGLLLLAVVEQAIRVDRDWQHCDLFVFCNDLSSPVQRACQYSRVAGGTRLVVLSPQAYHNQEQFRHQPERKKMLRDPTHVTTSAV